MISRRDAYCKCSVIEPAAGFLVADTDLEPGFPAFYLNITAGQLLQEIIRIDCPFRFRPEDAAAA